MDRLLANPNRKCVIILTIEGERPRTRGPFPETEVIRVATEWWRMCFLYEKPPTPVQRGVYSDDFWVQMYPETDPRFGAHIDIVEITE